MKIQLVLIALTGLIGITGCTKVTDDHVCSRAVIQICNPSDSLVIPYGLFTTVLNDTLFPGECIEEIYNSTIGDGTSESVEVFHNSGSNIYILEDCYARFELTRGQVYLQNDCNNGNFDPWSGETDTDCGGFCEPCPPLNLPCQIKKDEIEFVNSSLNNSLNFVDISEGVDDVRITFSLNMARINVLIDTKFPNKGRKFITSASHGTISPHRAVIDYYDGYNYNFALENQEIYFIKIDSRHWEIQFCDLEIDFMGTTEIASANFSFELPE